MLGAGEALAHDLALEGAAFVEGEVLRVVLRQPRLPLLVHQQHKPDPHRAHSSPSTSISYLSPLLPPRFDRVPKFLLPKFRSTQDFHLPPPKSQNIVLLPKDYTNISRPPKFSNIKIDSPDIRNIYLTMNLSLYFSKMF